VGKGKHVLCSKELTAQRKKACLRRAHTHSPPSAMSHTCETSEPLTQGTHGVMGREVGYVQKTYEGKK
jgi:hypothetical protein